MREPKFKAGDRVRFNCDYQFNSEGDEVTVLKFGTLGNGTPEPFVTYTDPFGEIKQAFDWRFDLVQHKPTTDYSKIKEELLNAQT